MFNPSLLKTWKKYKNMLISRSIDPIFENKVKNPDFENGLVKLQKKQLLNGDEQEAIKSFAIDVIPQKHIDSNEEEDFVSQAFKKAKHGGFLTSGSLKIEAEYNIFCFNFGINFAPYYGHFFCSPNLEYL